MRNSTSKNSANKKQLLGQYNTPERTVIELFDSIKEYDFNNFIFLEPSFGSGNIIKYVKDNCNFIKHVGYEIDKTYDIVIEDLKDKNTELEIKNFYDVKYDGGEVPFFIFGNPPYRTPNQSSKTHPKVIQNLREKYGISGIKEEAVYFILHTIDISPTDSEVFYILPKTIFQNPTKQFNNFRKIFNNFVKLKSIRDIKNVFDNVDQDLVLCHFTCIKPEDGDYKIYYNDNQIKLSEVWYDNVFTYYDIFKKTHLGSVPAESIFLSCSGENLTQFKSRLENIFSDNTIVNEENLVELLSYNGEPHLTDLKKKKKEKILTVLSYINQIKNKRFFDLSIFTNEDNYKMINHRKENRYYFRHDSLKSFDFVYLLNPNPQPSFYFTGNPTKISTDYFGYCDYDINRNSSPGAVRTVPIEGIGDNLKEEFIDFWNKNTDRSIEDIFEYLLEVSKSEWWLKRKKKYNKQYFCVPKYIIIEDFKK